MAGVQAHIPGIALSLRLKLTLWMVLIFLVVQLSLLLVFQVFQRRSINSFFDERIVARQRHVSSQLAPRLGSLTDESLHEFVESYRQFMVNTQIVVQIFDEHGDPVAASEAPRARLSERDWERIKSASEPEPVHVSVEALNDPKAESVRAAAGWATAPNGKSYLVLVAWDDLYARQIAQRLFFGAIIITFPIGLVAITVSAYVISGVAVQPIRAIRQMARGLEPERLGQSLPGSAGGSELAAVRQDLESTRKRLDGAFAAQERFMSNVSHELKTPIAVLMTEAQTIKLDTAGRDVRAFVTSTMDELDKLGRMVDSFLLLTRVRHGKASLPTRDFCLAREIMVESYEGCAPMAAQYGVRLSMHIPEGEHLDAAVRGNADLLRTVLDNLVRNAIRFSPKGQLIEIIGRVENGRLFITVRDHGPGIPADVLPRIFDRFSQANDEQLRGRGHGLGLAIAMGITEIHGGTITASSRSDQGCEFEVSLPLLRPSPEEPAAAASSA